MILLPPASMACLPRITDPLRRLQRRWSMRTGKLLTSFWYVNQRGDFATRACVRRRHGELMAYVEIRHGFHAGEYRYERLAVSPDISLYRSRRVFLHLCQQAEHLAQLRYRFTAA